MISLFQVFQDAFRKIAQSLPEKPKYLFGEPGLIQAAVNEQITFTEPCIICLPPQSVDNLENVNEFQYRFFVQFLYPDSLSAGARQKNVEQFQETRPSTEQRIQGLYEIQTRQQDRLDKLAKAEIMYQNFMQALINANEDLYFAGYEVQILNRGTALLEYTSQLSGWNVEFNLTALYKSCETVEQAAKYLALWLDTLESETKELCH